LHHLIQLVEEVWACLQLAFCPRQATHAYPRLLSLQVLPLQVLLLQLLLQVLLLPQALLLLPLLQAQLCSVERP
jgi:hypothetical protein